MAENRQVIIKDATIVSKRGKEYLFGTVVEDTVFEVGHRVLTSEIKVKNEEEQYVITKSGTFYKYENMLTNEDLIAKLKATEQDKHKLEYIIDCIL